VSLLAASPAACCLVAGVGPLSAAPLYPVVLRHPARVAFRRVAAPLYPVVLRHPARVAFRRVAAPLYPVSVVCPLAAVAPRPPVVVPPHPVAVGLLRGAG